MPKKTFNNQKITFPKKSSYNADVKNSSWGNYGGCDAFGCKGENCPGYKHREDAVLPPDSDLPLTIHEVLHEEFIQPWWFGIHSIALTIYLKTPDDFEYVANRIFMHFYSNKFAGPAMSGGTILQANFKLANKYHGYKDTWRLPIGFTFSANPITTGGATYKIDDQVTITTPMIDLKDVNTGGVTDNPEGLSNTGGATDNSEGLFNSENPETLSNTGGATDNSGGNKPKKLKVKTKKSVDWTTYCSVEIAESICHSLTVEDFNKLDVLLWNEYEAEVKVSRLEYSWVGAPINASQLYSWYRSSKVKTKTKISQFRFCPEIYAASQQFIPIDNSTFKTHNSMKERGYLLTFGHSTSDRIFHITDLPRRGANYVFKLRDEWAQHCWKEISKSTIDFDRFMREELVSFIDFVETTTHSGKVNISRCNPMPGWDEFTYRFPVYVPNEDDALHLAGALNYYDYPNPVEFYAKGQHTTYRVNTLGSSVPIDRSTLKLPNYIKLQIIDFLRKYRYPFPFEINENGNTFATYFPPISLAIPKGAWEIKKYDDADLLDAIAYMGSKVFNASPQ